MRFWEGITIKRFLSTIISIILFALTLSWISHVPVSQREPNVYYFTFLDTFVFTIVYAGPVYILIGLPLSILIDKVVEKYNVKLKRFRYLIRFGLYSIAGMVVGYIYLIIIFQRPLDNFSFSSLLYGFIASNIYFHLFLLISNLKKKQGKSTE